MRKYRKKGLRTGYTGPKAKRDRPDGLKALKSTVDALVKSIQGRLTHVEDVVGVAPGGDSTAPIVVGRYGERPFSFPESSTVRFNLGFEVWLDVRIINGKLDLKSNGTVGIQYAEARGLRVAVAAANSPKGF